MNASLYNFYFYLILKKPRYLLLTLCALVVFFAWQSLGFRMDASSDSIVLENDQSLKYYRAIEANYGSNDFLVITYTPENDVFSSAVKKDIRQFSNSLKEIKSVESVVTILDVPLIDSPHVSLSDIQEKILTLESPETDLILAKQEILNSPLYISYI